MKYLSLFFVSVYFWAGASLPVSPARADVLDENLVARWSFQSGSLESDVGDYAFSEAGRGSLKSQDGTVTLSGHKHLMVPEINSTDLPKLAEGVTIWARLRFDELPPKNEANVLGLQAVASDGSWDAITFSLLHRVDSKDASNSGIIFLAKLDNGTELGMGPSGKQPVALGEFINVAIVFDGANHRASLWINDHEVTRKNRDAEQLQAFAAFAIGMLTKHNTSCTITFDEVRIYSTVLGSEWLEEIEPLSN